MMSPIMSAAENKRLLQDIFTELAKGNSRPLIESMADDVRWTVTGQTKWSKTYEGKEAILGELFGALRSRIDGRTKTIAHRFIAEDDHVVVEARGDNRTRSGMPYNNSYCFVIRLEDGKVKELTEYMDTELVTAALGEEG